MGLRARLVVASALVGLVIGGVAFSAPSGAVAATPRVVIYDNDAPTPAQGMDPRTGEWSFYPQHITIMKGEQIVFDSPAGNKRPHNVTSITNAGSPTEPNLEAGARFTSGLNREAWMQPGATWTLDSTNAEPGHYPYYCSLHPWMVATITVLAP